MKLTAEQRRAAILDASRADLANVITLRAMGDATALTPARRDELLAKCMAGDYVELEVELEAYSQQPGVMNRKFIRVRDGAMQALGRSGKTTPLMRDHDQGNVLARGGTITSSTVENPVEGHYTIMQTAKLTAPWAVELALRGLLDRLSIGMCPTGPVLCSICGTEVFEDCWHWRGDTVETEDDGEQTVEWIFTAAELVETSVVSVPAVKSAHIEAIRSALALSSDNGNRAPTAQRYLMDPKLALILGLAATAGIPEALSAVENLQRERDTANVERDAAKTSLAISEAKNAILANDGKASTEDKFIQDALLSGRITKGDEPQWRKLHQLSAPEAKTMMAARPEGCATPVGQPRQSANDPSPPSAAAPTSEAVVFAGVFGAPDPAKAVADASKKGN